MFFLFQYFLLRSLAERMSFYNTSSQQRQIFMMRKRHMHNILEYNKRQMIERQQRKEKEHNDLRSYSMRCDQQALEELLSENQMRTRKRRDQKHMLSQVYDRQMRDRMQKDKMQKEKDLMYARKQEEYRQFEEARRMQELSKMYNRLTYSANIGNHHLRTKTEPVYECQRYNPQSYKSTTPMKNLDNVEVKLHEIPNYNKNENTIRKNMDSLDKLNYQYQNKQGPLQ